MKLNASNLHSYQNISVQHILDNPFCGLFLDMGLGKTVSTLTAVELLLNDYLDVDKVLVIAPKRVTESVWTDEIEKWEHLTGLKTSRIIGNPKQRIHAYKAKADIYLISRDNIAWLIGQFGGMMLPFDMLIVDESSSFKNHKSQRFKAIKRVLPSFNRVVILTGTPAPNGLADIWTQIYLLDRGERLGKFIGRYRDEYFKPGLSKGHIVYKYNIRKNSEERIYDKISDICISMKAKDHLNLPERIDNYIDVKFSDALMKRYLDFEREQVLDYLEDNDGSLEISATNAAALSNKLLQFANGAIYDEDKNYHEIHDLKLDALEEVIESAGGKPVLIARSYRSDLYRIMKKLKKYNPRELKTDKDIKDWNDGKVQVMVMHPASGGHGLNLQYGGNIIVWYGLTWSLELYQQFNARLDRQGQTESVFIHHLVAYNTIDMEVVNRLASKDKKQEHLMQAIKARIKKYAKETLK